MKKAGFFGWVLVLLVIVLAFAGSFPALAHNVYFVATTGNDNNPGTLKQPFATWQKAINKAVAGDTVYVRGGVYRVDASATAGLNINKDGTAEKPICFFNYPGEIPILDMSNNTNETGAMIHGVLMNDADYWHIKGIEIRDLVQTPLRKVAAGFSLQYCEHNIIEQVTTHKLGYFGFYSIYSDDILFLNCDAYDVYDSSSTGYNADGGNADGWHISYLERTDTITLRGCRMWYCSDDGIDCYYSDGAIIIDRCWSFRNGRGDGGGNGYKLGPGWTAGATTDTLRFIYHNLSFDNSGTGFIDNKMPCAFLYYNNTTFRNGSAGYRNYSNYAPDIFKNNISYLDKSAPGLQSVDIHVYNSWNTTTGVTLSDADFVSLDTTGVTGKRKPDGSLPDISFLKLKKGSDIINAGKDVGLPFEESAPDMGAYEYKSPVTGITVSGAGGATAIAANDGTLQLSASILPADATNKTVKWSVINITGQATINSSGLMSAIANGTVTAKATASDGSGISGTRTITISNQVNPVTGITVTGKGGATTITTDNGTLQLSADVLPSNADNKTVTWIVTNGTGQALINSSGLVTALANGTITVTATSTDGSGIKGTLKITIFNQVIPVSGITIAGVDGINSIATDNGTLQLIATVLPTDATNKNITWTIENGTGQATISTGGLVTAVDNGTITAKATAGDGSGISGILSIDISNQVIPVSSISVTGSGDASIITEPGGTLQLSAAILPGHATDKSVTWSITDNTGHAVISTSGLVTAVYNGTVTAKATANDGSGESGSIIITIQQPVTPVTDAKEIYIDPCSYADPMQDGTMDHPYSSWNMVTWKDGYSYLQKKGSVSVVTKINIGASHVVLGSYGEGEKPVIQSNENDFVLRAYEKSNILIKDLNLINPNGISCLYIIGESCDSIYIENCTFESTQNGVRLLNGNNIILRYNTFISCSNAVYCYTNTSSIYYNVFQNNEVAINSMASVGTTNIYNNVFFDNAVAISNTNAELTLYNNIFYLAKSTDKAINNNKLSNLVSDHNIFYPEQEGFIRIGDKAYNSLSEYQQVFNMDMNSITDDPEFIDIYNQDFTIEPFSPAVNAGKLLGLQQDFYGSTVPSGGLPDIGLAELKNPSDSVTAFEGNLNDPVQEAFQVFPNPSGGVINVLIKKNNLNGALISIKNIAGKTVYENIYRSDHGFLIEINLSNMQKGIYIIAIEDKTRTLSKPIIIQ